MNEQEELDNLYEMLRLFVTLGELCEIGDKILEPE